MNYFVDFDGTHATHEDELSHGGTEDEPSNASATNNDVDEPVQHTAEDPGATDTKRQGQIGKTAKDCWDRMRRVWGWLRRMVGAFMTRARSI